MADWDTALILGTVGFIFVGIPAIVGYKAMNEEYKLERARIEQGYERHEDINVLGRDTADIYYDIEGERAFVEIDGVPVEEYLKADKKEVEK